ncbi:hypothetical protein CcaCcLH18_10921 [Colletotrichum camelliae]|nr:hypothetical protein CcaCcLH18_10921 [Colletotrichum camelliae]
MSRTFMPAKSAIITRGSQGQAALVAAVFAGVVAGPGAVASQTLRRPADGTERRTGAGADEYLDVASAAPVQGPTNTASMSVTIVAIRISAIALMLALPSPVVFICPNMRHKGIPGFEGALRAACIIATGSVMLGLAMYLAARYPPHARLVRAFVLSVGVLDLSFLPAYSVSPLHARLSSEHGQLTLMMALYIGAPVVLFSIEILSIVNWHVCLSRLAKRVDTGDEATASVDGACQLDNHTSCGLSITWVDWPLTWAQDTIVQALDAMSAAFGLPPEQLKHCLELLDLT